MDLDDVRKLGYEREIRCGSCGVVHRWTVTASLLRSPLRAAT